LEVQTFIRKGDHALDVSSEETDGSVMVSVEWETVSYRVLADIEDETRFFPEEGSPKYVMDIFKEEELIWKKLLRRASWFKVEREGGQISSEQYEAQILALDPRVAIALVLPVMQDLFISPAENQRLYKQCVALFAAKSRGVTYPDKWIRRYCELVTFWEKFGLNAFDLEKIPQAEALRLRRIAMMGAERQDYEQRTLEAQSRAKQGSSRGGRG